MNMVSRLAISPPRGAQQKTNHLWHLWKVDGELTPRLLYGLSGHMPYPSGNSRHDAILKDQQSGVRALDKQQLRRS